MAVGLSCNHPPHFPLGYLASHLHQEKALAALIVVAREKKQRISTDGGGAAWPNPFATLNLDSFPEGASAPQQPHPKEPKKRIERLLLRRETAHRGGKTVLVLERFSPQWDPAKLDQLLQELKSTLGCGGKVVEGKIQIQGELADRLIPLLQAQGLGVKRGW